jgi:hypothetical protein
MSGLRSAAGSQTLSQEPVQPNSYQRQTSKRVSSGRAGCGHSQREGSITITFLNPRTVKVRCQDHLPFSGQFRAEKPVQPSVRERRKSGGSGEAGSVLSASLNGRHHRTRSRADPAAAAPPLAQPTGPARWRVAGPFAASNRLTSLAYPLHFIKYPRREDARRAGTFLPPFSSSVSSRLLQVCPFKRLFPWRLRAATQSKG